MNFRGANLRGKSFKNQKLIGADFSHADIRGANFKGANLQNSNFSNVKAGLQIHKLILLVILASFLLILASLITTYASFTIIEMSFTVSFFWSTFVLLTLIVLSALIIFVGLETATGITTLIYICIILLIIASPNSLNLNINDTALATLTIGSLCVAAILAGIVVLALGVAIIQILLRVIGVILPVIMMLFGSVLGIILGEVVKNQLIIGVPIVLILVSLSIYIGKQALNVNHKYFRIKAIAIFFCSQGGTSFYGADLSHANFTQATLKSTDFRKSTIRHTLWRQAKHLNKVRPGRSYLENSSIVELLVTGQGQDKDYSLMNLRSLNLQGANLQDTNFSSSDLSEANLQDADLSRAKLKQSQLDGTDFTGAILTGAYIEDWGITNETKFDGVLCEYVYMRLPTKENPDPIRKPDNNKEVFAPGEFGDFIKPIVDTLDLYHSQGVNPRAIATAFKELAEDNPQAELEIVAIERRGDDKILLRAKTSTSANKSELSRQYFVYYNEIKALVEKDFQTLIIYKESQIARLENMITTSLERPSFYAETYNNQGDTIMSEGSKKQSTFNFQNSQIAGGVVDAEIVNTNKIGGDINNYTTEQKQNLAQAAADIQQLLYQLAQTNTTTSSTITEAIYREIKSNPTLRARLQSALKAGGLEALKAIFNHPLFSIPAETIKGWLEAE